MKDLIKLKILEASVYWRDPLTDEALRLYTNELDDLDASDVCDAFNAAKADPKQKRVPLPSEIRALIKPKTTDMEKARIVAALIIEAIGKIGPYGSAKEYLGEIGWEVVCRMGGWQTLCVEVTNENLGIMQAQIRELAASIMTASRAGELREPPSLPRAIGSGGMKSLGDILSQALQTVPGGTKEQPRLAGDRTQDQGIGHDRGQS